MSNQGFALFETAIGSCGIAWGTRGLVGLQLPEASAAATRKRIQQRFPAAAEGRPTRDARAAIDAITRLLSGRHVELAHVPLDMEGVPPFHRRIYEEARRIPAGRTMTYGQVATRAGSPKASRAVGQAMRRNPFPIVVPCHRVLASGGKAGGFTAPGGLDTKRRLLEIEGASGALAPASKPATAKTAGSAKPAATTKTAATTKPARAAKPSAGPAATGGGKAGGVAAVIDPRRALRDLRAADPVLAALIDEVGAFGMDLEETRSIFSSLARAIVYQQLTGKAAATILGRVQALFPRARGGFGPDDILAAREEDLRGAGLSRAKVAALRDLATRTSDGSLPTLARVRRMTDDEIVEALTAVRGIGRWTVEMLLMFGLGRPDVMPVDDFGVRKGFQLAYSHAEMPRARDLAAHAERWRPWRSVAAWYMWRAVDLARARAAAAPAPKPAGKSAGKSATKSAPKPAAKPARKTTTKSASKPARKPKRKSATQPAAKPARKPAARPRGKRR